jgi:hypothetical protein
VKQSSFNYGKFYIQGAVNPKLEPCFFFQVRRKHKEIFLFINNYDFTTEKKDVFYDIDVSIIKLLIPLFLDVLEVTTMAFFFFMNISSVLNKD